MTIVEHDAALHLAWGPASRPQLRSSPSAESLGIAGRRIFFRKAVSQDELLSYTASADVGVVPYMTQDIARGCGTGVLQTSSSSSSKPGFPIITSDSTESSAVS